MKFRTPVEPPEPMRGLEVPPAVIQALGAGKRPAVTVTINGHSWRSRVAASRSPTSAGLSPPRTCGGWRTTISDRPP